MLRNAHFLAALHFPHFPDQIVIENSNIPFKYHVFIYLLNIIVMFFFHRLVCLIVLLNTFLTKLLRLLILILHFNTRFQMVLHNISCHQVLFQINVIHNQTFLKWVLLIIIFVDLHFHLFLNILEKLVQTDLFPRQSIFFFYRQHFLYHL